MFQYDMSWTFSLVQYKECDSLDKFQENFKLLLIPDSLSSICRDLSAQKFWVFKVLDRVEIFS